MKYPDHVADLIEMVNSEDLNARVSAIKPWAKLEIRWRSRR